MAGRCGVLSLLPPSLQELQQIPNAPTELLDVLWQGHYPRIYGRQIPAQRWLADYILVCHLLGIRNAEELRHHPLRGAIFESWVVLEVLKGFTNRGVSPSLYHYRESRGLEIDLLLEMANQLNLIEIKSGATVNSSFFKNLNKFTESEHSEVAITPWLIYGGAESYMRQGCKVRS